MTTAGPRWSARRLVRGRPAAILLVLAVAAGVATRVAVQSVSPVFASDTFQSLQIARSLLEGRGFTSGGAEHPDESRTVLFPLSIAAASVVARDVETAARLIVLLCGALVVVPMFFFARQAFGPGAALAALPLGAASCLVGASSRLLATPLFILLVLMALAAAWEAAGRSRPWWWVAAGACAGLSALARPEGLAFALALAFWALLADRATGPTRASRWARRARAAGVAVLAFAAVYAPYVIWASAKLGRFAPAPGIEYVQAERRVSDHLGLREIASSTPWTARAHFMLTRDHRALFLETYFLTGAFPEPDSPMLPAAGVAAPVLSGDDIPLESILRRRWNITKGNLLRAPKKAAWGHFFPAVSVGLVVVGLSGALRHRAFRGLSLLAIFGVASLAPFVSHIEDRFFYLPFAIFMLVGAYGWERVGSLIHRWLTAGEARIWAAGLAHAGLFAAVAWSGARHEGVRRAALERAVLLRSTAAAETAELPSGPILAIDPHFPYWAHRPYRGLPFGTPEAIEDYARAQGATALVLEGRRDLDQRPDLSWLTAESVPRPFRLVRSVPHPEGGDLLVFAIDRGPAPSAP